MESQLRSPRRSRPNIGGELSVEGDWAPRARVVGRPSHAEIPIAPRLLVFLQLIDAEISAVHTSILYRWSLVLVLVVAGFVWVALV